MTKRLRGEGHYDEHSDGWRWRGRYKDALTGQTKVKVIYRKNKNELRQEVKKWQTELAAGQTKKLNIDEAADIWLDLIVKPACKAKTYQNYDICVRNHFKPKFGKLKITEITPFMLQNYFNELLADRSAVTVASIRTIFIVFFNAMINFGYILINPAKKTKPPKVLPAAKIALTKEEINRLLKVLEPLNMNDDSLYLQRCYYTAVKLAIETGLREGEIFGLSWESVDFRNSMLRVEKTLSCARGNGANFDTPKTKGSIRNVVLAESTLNDLKEWQQFQSAFAQKFKGVYVNKNRLVFTNIYGKAVSMSNFLHRCFTPALKKAEIKGANFHSLRHTHASQLIAAGVDVQIVSQRLGHSNLSTTMNIYKHVLKDIQELAKDQLNEIYK